MFQKIPLVEPHGDAINVQVQDPPSPKEDGGEKKSKSPATIRLVCKALLSCKAFPSKWSRRMTLQGAQGCRQVTKPQSKAEIGLSFLEGFHSHVYRAVRATAFNSHKGWEIDNEMVKGIAEVCRHLTLLSLCMKIIAVIF